MNNLQKARARLLLNNPFFGTLVMTTPLVERRDVPTACTDMAKIYYNPDFFAPLSVEEVTFVLAHEVMHIAFEHGLRMQGRNPMMWNVATDFAINYILKDAGFSLVDGVLYDAKYGSMSAEEIYDKLQREMQKKPESGNDPRIRYSNPMEGDLETPATNAPEEIAKMQRSIQQRVAQAANMARLAGNLPGGLERFIDQILNPAVPWQDVLREYMTKIVKDAESWERRNRRFRNIYLPTRHSVHMGPIAFIGDTSGSIGNEELARVGTEVASVAEAVNPEKIHMVWADTHVAGEQEFEPGDIIACKPAGGGGTDMRVPLEYVAKYEPEVVVLCTDGYTPWPDCEPDFPLIVLCTTDVVAPVGVTIRV